MRNKPSAPVNPLAQADNPLDVVHNCVSVMKYVGSLQTDDESTPVEDEFRAQEFGRWLFQCVVIQALEYGEALLKHNAEMARAERAQAARSAGAAA